MLKAVLKVIGGKQDGKLIPLDTKKFLIGREQDCHLRPSSDSVSRHHCVVSIDEFSVRVRDLGSSNGTFLNETRLLGAQEAQPGDRLKVGSLEFEIEFAREGVPAEAGKADAESGTTFDVSEFALPNAEEMSDTAVMSGDTAIIKKPNEPATPEEMNADDATPDEAPAAEEETPPVEAAPPAADPVPVEAAEPQPAPQADPNLAAQQQQQMPMQPPGFGGYPPQMQPPGYPPQVPQPYPYGAPQQQPYPYGVPQPQLGYPAPPPGYGMPQPGMPYPGQYPQQPAAPYPAMPGQMPMQPASEEENDEEPVSLVEDGEAPAITLPDPSDTGLKEPESTGDEKEAAPKVEQPNPAADILNKYKNRR